MAPRIVFFGGRYEPSYREQTGRQMSDYILMQQADKVVRYTNFP